jgi:hypothetical protein
MCSSLFAGRYFRGIDKRNFFAQLQCYLHEAASLSPSAEQNNNRKQSLETLLLKRKEKHSPIFLSKTFFLLDFYKTQTKIIVYMNRS